VGKQRPATSNTNEDRMLTSSPHSEIRRLRRLVSILEQQRDHWFTAAQALQEALDATQEPTDG
jgi:hypothetical protein